MSPNRLLIIACGAIAREINAVAKANGWQHIKITQIPAELHNHPEKIPSAVEQRLQDFAGEYEHVFVAFADCGTGGMLDKVLDKYQVQRLSGAHCYEFFAGTAQFNALAEAEAGTFYLTDYLAKHFQPLIMEGMGLDKKPALTSMMFGNYKKVVYLTQADDRQLEHYAEAAAEKLGLAYEKIVTGYGQLESELESYMQHYDTQVIKWQH